MSMHRKYRSKMNRLITISAGATTVVLFFLIIFLLSQTSQRHAPVSVAMTITSTMRMSTATVVQSTPEVIPATPVAVSPTPAQPFFASPSTTSPEPQNTLNITNATPTQMAYTIQSGDSLISISSQFGVTVEALKAANRLTGDIIYAGDTLVIPSNDGITITVTPTLAFTITPTVVVTGYTGIHWVQPGETVGIIANQYGLTSQTLRTINHMAGDAILPGQQLWISPTLESSPDAYHFSTLNEDRLNIVYPLSLEEERFSLHYTPNTYPAMDPQSVALLIGRSLTHIEILFGTPIYHHVDVYAAGSLFEAPEQILRGRSFSAHWRTLFLHDGTGNAADQQYIIAHELTHLYAWNVFGIPSSVMLSEGAAVYSGMMLISGSNHLPIKVFCAAYLQAGQLPDIAASLRFNGHILNLPNYYAAGCFVGYLVETYGPEKFGMLYPTNNFDNVYGKTVWALEQEWRETLFNISISFKPDDLVSAVNEVQTAYANFLPAFSGTQTQRNAYYHLDLARLALLEGRFNDVTLNLEAFQDALK